MTLFTFQCSAEECFSRTSANFEEPWSSGKFFFFWRGEKVEYLVQCSFTLWAIAFVVLNTVQWRLGSTVIQLSHVALKSQSLPFSRPDHFLGFTEELLTTLNSEMTLLGNSAEHSYFLLNSNGFTANFLLSFILRKIFFLDEKLVHKKNFVAHWDIWLKPPKFWKKAISTNVLCVFFETKTKWTAKWIDRKTDERYRRNNNKFSICSLQLNVLDYLENCSGQYVLFEVFQKRVKFKWNLLCQSCCLKKHARNLISFYNKNFSVSLIKCQSKYELFAGINVILQRSQIWTDGKCEGNKNAFKSEKKHKSFTWAEQRTTHASMCVHNTL